MLKQRCTLSASASWLLGLIVGCSFCATTSLASSHREAPSILKTPMVDGTDFYMFRSYEEGRSGFVTLIANYNPLQDPFGGPNYFPLDDNAFYDIHIANNGDANEDITFRFQFNQDYQNLALNVGDPGSTSSVTVPFANIGAVTAGSGGEASLNIIRSYTLNVIRGRLNNNGFARRGRRSGRRATNASDGSTSFRMPFDNVGNKSFPDYSTYANQFIHNVNIPGCDTAGRVFVGQRKESFAVNLGETFDLVNISNPVGSRTVEASSTENKNITSLALEIPTECLTEGNGDVIGGWTTSRRRQNTSLRRSPNSFDSAERLRQRNRTVQVSRLGNPLVNELVIGLDKKDRFNSSHPRNDTQFLTFVTNPTLPEVLELLFSGIGVAAPNSFPRTDLIQVFLTGVPSLNQDGSTAEFQRLNTSIAPTAQADQNNLGVVGGDNAGFPNGRRPGDDTVDIALRAVMGVLINDSSIAPSGSLPFTDGADQNSMQFDATFPYLTTPVAGSPNSTS